MLALLIACSAPDTGDTTDTTDTADAPVVLDDLLPTATDGTWGCRWMYLGANLDTHTLVADLVLPEADEATRSTLHYARALAAEESLQIGGGAGAGELTVFNCSDVMDITDGVRVWTATAATLTIDAVYVEDRPEWTCDGVSDNPVYDVTVSITDASFVDETGVEGTLSAWGPASVQVADSCGG